MGDSKIYCYANSYYQANFSVNPSKMLEEDQSLSGEGSLPSLPPLKKASLTTAIYEQCNPQA